MPPRPPRRARKWGWLVLLLLFVLFWVGTFVFEGSSYQVTIFQFTYLLGPMVLIALLGNISASYRRWFRDDKKTGAGAVLGMIAFQLGAALFSMVLLSPWVLIVNAVSGPSEITTVDGEVQYIRRGRGFLYHGVVFTDSGAIDIGFSPEEAETINSGDVVSLRRRIGGFGIPYRYRWDD